MSTATFSIRTNAFPSITNDIKYAIYNALAPLAEVSSQTFSAPHAVRDVQFTGLVPGNYIFKLLEMSGVTVVRSIVPDYNFVPNTNEIIYYPPIEIEADVTTGVTNGATGFTFDGSGGKFDWRGRNVYVERVGQGTMHRGIQYTWDSTTGVFALVDALDTIQPHELFNVEFDLEVKTSGLPGPQPPFTAVLNVTNNTTLVSGDIGKKIIIKGAVPYLELTLPDAATVVENIVTYFEFGIGSHVNAKILPFAGDTIDWGKGTLDHITGGVCETLALFVNAGVWRVHAQEGNFLRLGRIISTDGDDTTEYNAQELDGSDMAIATYKRLYEDYVQKLDPSQVVNYSVWASEIPAASGLFPNKTKFSYSNGTNFHVPDRRNLFQRATDGVILPGIYAADTVGAHSHRVITGGSGGSADPGKSLVRQSYNGDAAQAGASSLGPYIESTGTETKPKNYIVRQFILI
jgi:hypothetical protein